jgi:hypothetical protein
MFYFLKCVSVSHLPLFHGADVTVCISRTQDGAMYQDLPHILLHGKRSQNAFSLDVRHPLTLLQAFGIALCSFENSVLETAF